jgi:hypothetical protein
MATLNKPTNRPIIIKIDDKDLLAILRTFKKMDEIAKKDMKQTTKDIANEAASAIGSALSRTKQGSAIARTIKVSSSYAKGPRIEIGGDKQRLSSGNVPGEILMGTEFGANNNVRRKRKSGTYIGLRQFERRSPREGKGNAGYFIFPTLKAMQPYITRRWVQEVDRIRREWRERI